MGLIDRWNRFACKKIKFNDTWDISIGRLILGIGIFLVAEFTSFPVSWIFLILGIRYHKKDNNKKTEEEVKDKNEN